MKRFVTACRLCAFLVITISFKAGADTYWQGKEGDWSVAANWTAGEPTATDNAYINNGGTAVVKAAGETCGYLMLAKGKSDIGYLKIESGSLKTKYNEYIGGYGIGKVIHNDGENYVDGNLILGTYDTAVGTYTINKGLLNVKNKISSGPGSSTFTINGGAVYVGSTISLDTFKVADSAGSTANFTMGIANDLTATDLYVGGSGDGTFIQSGATALISNLTLAEKVGSSGAYRVDGGLLRVTGSILDGPGSSSLTLNAGQIDADDIDVDTFTVAYSSASNVTHTMNTGDRISVVNENIGRSGTGTLTQNGGTNTITNVLKVGYDGGPSGADGTYDLNNGTLTAGEIVLEGYASGPFTGTNGTLNWNAGTLNTGQITINDRGIMNVDQSCIYNTVLKINSGGLADFGTHSLTLDKTPTGLNAKISMTGGSLHAGSEYIGYDDVAAVGQSGGTNTVSGSMYLGYNATGSGVYNIARAKMNAGSLYVGKDGHGALSITDSAATITISQLLSFGSDSEFAAVPGSTIHMTGSAFENFSTDPTELLGLSNLELIFEGGTDDIDPFEVAGAVDAGFDYNFALGTLTLGGKDVGMVRLVDNFDNGNRGDSGSECLYLHALQINEGSELDVADLGLYVEGNVETLLNDWIADARLFSSLGPIQAIYDPMPDWTYIVPEPATFALLGLGTLALRKKYKK